MPLTIRRLDRSHNRGAFDCGEAALNNYLRLYALQNQERHQVGTTYVATDETQPDVVLGYYTLAMSELPSHILAGSPVPYRTIPVILLARLAVDQRFQGRGVGETLLSDALERSLRIAREIGCRLVILDAYPSAVGWYAKYGLVELGGDPTSSPTRKMGIDLRVVAKSLARAKR